MRIVKRYKNRRLYDTQTSRTITQFDLARMIQDGHKVKVIDSTTGEDITLAVIGRVMLAETSSWGNAKDSTELLRTMIIVGGEKSMSILKNTILASIGVLQVTKSKAEKIIDDLIKKGDLDKSDRKKAVMELLDKAEKSTADLRKKFATEAQKATKSVSKMTAGLNWATQEDLKKLERKVNSLAKQIKDMKA
jgi:polyhydroxyalkanoate synthesis repressor PhaR